MRDGTFDFSDNEGKVYWCSGDYLYMSSLRTLSPIFVETRGGRGSEKNAFQLLIRLTNCEPRSRTDRPQIYALCGN